MREVERDRFVAATPREIRRLLSPRNVVAWEGSFEVADVDDSGGETVVTATGPAITFRLRFEERPEGYRYEQAGEGPFERMETWLTVTPEDAGSRLRARSRVALSLPLPFADRIAAWKRGGELDRLLDGLVAEV